jgi:hypothetical protein
MAKKSMDWDLNIETGILKVDHKADAGTILKSQDFDLKILFEDWADLTSFQKNMIAYGAKQKMSDACAANKDLGQTVNDRIVTLSNMWGRFVDGVWTQKPGERDTLKKKIEAGIAEGKIPMTDELKAALTAMGIKC